MFAFLCFVLFFYQVKNNCTPIYSRLLVIIVDNSITLTLLFLLATEHTLLRMFLNISRQILFPGDLYDAALKNFCTIKCGTFNCLHGLQFPAHYRAITSVLYLNTGLIQLDYFDRSVYSHLHYAIKLGLVSKSILFVSTVVYEQCYE